MQKKPYQRILKTVRIIILKLNRFHGVKEIMVSGYYVILRLLVYLFSRHNEVKAIYLRGGLAREEIEPGDSDIDLIIITETLHGKKDYLFNKMIAKRWSRLRTFLPILGEMPIYNLKDLEFICSLGSNDIVDADRWRLVYGLNLVERFPRQKNELQTAIAFYLLNFWYFKLFDSFLKNDYRKETYLRMEFKCIYYIIRYSDEIFDALCANGKTEKTKEFSLKNGQLSEEKEAVKHELEEIRQNNYFCHNALELLMRWCSFSFSVLNLISISVRNFFENGPFCPYQITDYLNVVPDEWVLRLGEQLKDNLGNIKIQEIKKIFFIFHATDANLIFSKYLFLTMTEDLPVETLKRVLLYCKQANIASSEYWTVIMSSSALKAYFCCDPTLTDLFRSSIKLSLCEASDIFCGTDKRSLSLYRALILAFFLVIRHKRYLLLSEDELYIRQRGMLETTNILLSSFGDKIPSFLSSSVNYSEFPNTNKDTRILNCNLYRLLNIAVHRLEKHICNYT